MVSVAFPFYAGKGVVGWLAMGLLFWVTVAALLAAQYFFPIQGRLDRKFRKIVRKSFLLLFDNTIFTIGLLRGRPRDPVRGLRLHGVPAARASRRSSCGGTPP